MTHPSDSEEAIEYVPNEGPAAPPAQSALEDSVLKLAILHPDVIPPLSPHHFTQPGAARIYRALSTIKAQGATPSVETLAAHFGPALPEVGGFPYLLQLTDESGGTALTNTKFLVTKLKEAHLTRELQRIQSSISDRAADDPQAVLAQIEQTVRNLSTDSAQSLPARPLGDFNLPEANDPNVLIGKRWLSRGDIFILASTSGMGKSSLSIQAAVTWGLGQPLFGGFRPHRKLKSLIVQSEDGDGDIAEVRLSLEYAMKLDDEQKATVNQNVIIVTDRVHRGVSFRAELKRLIELHAPDIVWINPLLAFLGGDVNDSTDVGAFLREQLNSLNEPARFAYGIVHHTAKPPKERKERQWNEVMYEMAGSADLTNAARAVLALQATETQGEFKLIAAKRGPRAGLTERMPGSQNPELMVDQPTSVINVRHSKDKMIVNGQELPVIHWERFDAAKATAAPEKTKTGRKPSYFITDFYRWIPKGVENALPASQIFRLTNGATGITDNGFKKLLFRASEEGAVFLTDIPGRGPCYHL